MSKSFKLVCLVLIIITVAAFFLMTPTGHDGDLQCWLRWIKSVRDTGLGLAYTNDEIAYHPFYLYIMWLYGKFYLTDYSLENHLNILKSMIFFFDIAGIAVLAWFFDKRKISPWLALIVLLSPGYFYNTVYWGQVDSVYTTFCFAAVVFAIMKKPYLSLICFLFGFCMKLQAIVFLPLLGLMWLPFFTISIKEFTKGIITMVITIIFLIFPFIYSEQVSGLWRVITGAVNFFPVVSMRGDNIWYLLLPGKDLSHYPDNMEFLNITYKNWGFLLYVTSVIAVLFPLRKSLLQLFREKYKFRFSDETVALILLGGSLLPMVFFFFNTQMHERYAHAAVIFSGAFSFVTRKTIYFILVSAAVMLNQDVVIHALNMPESWYRNIPLYNEQVIAVIYLVSMIYGFYWLYRISHSYNLPGQIPNQ